MKDAKKATKILPAMKNLPSSVRKHLSDTNPIHYRLEVAY